jgi:hypothetical protein
MENNNRKNFEILKSAKIAKITPTHIIYYCPFCKSVRGKEDNDGKFYFSKEKHVGWCFKCHTKVIGNNFSYNAGDNFTPIEKQIEEKNQPKLLLNFSENNPAWLKLSEESINYLKSRNPKIINYLDELNLKEVQINSNHEKVLGILIPFYHKKIIYNFQIRFYKNNNDFRYCLAHGSNFLPYSPDKYYLKENPELFGMELTICEGVFDAIALKILGYYNPLAILGSSPSQEKIEFIKKLNPLKINIAMDDERLNFEVLEKLKKEINCSYELLKFEAKDPEEYLRSLA